MTYYFILHDTIRIPLTEPINSRAHSNIKANKFQYTLLSKKFMDFFRVVEIPKFSKIMEMGIPKTSKTPVGEIPKN